MQAQQVWGLTAYEQWVCWNYSKDKGKVPIDPLTGALASVTDKDTWGSYEQVLNAVEEYGCSGMGFVVTADDPICGIDLDNCIDPDTGKIEPWALQIVSDLWTYTEVSPSGTGIRAFIKGTKPGSKCRTENIEIYDHDRFLTVTANVLNGVDIEERQDELEALYTQIFGDASPHRESAVVEDKVEHTIPEDDVLLAKARNASTGAKFCQLYDQGNTYGYQSASEADLALAGYLAFWTGKDAERMEDLLWQSALRREKWTSNRSYIPRTVGKAIEECTKVYDPDWYGNFLEYRVSQLSEWRLTYSWPGRGGATDKDVYGALLTIANVYGRVHEHSITVKASRRDLAILAGIGSPNTILKSLKRLEDEHGVVEKVRKGGTDGEASIYRLGFTQNCTSPICVHSTGSPSGKPPANPQLLKIRNSSQWIGTIGKRNSQILDFVAAHARVVTLEEIAKYLGVRKDHVKSRNILTLLAAPGFLIEQDGGYVVPDNIEELLAAHLEDDGHNEAQRRQRARYEREREAYELYKGVAKDHG